MTSMAHLVFFYAGTDRKFGDQLEKRLIPFHRQSRLAFWHPGLLNAGDSLVDAMEEQLRQATFVALLISPDLLSSMYDLVQRICCHSTEDRIRIIPILCRPTHLESTPFAALTCLPSNGKPIQSWPSTDAAWVDVMRGVERLLSDSEPAYKDDRSRQLGKTLKSLYNQRRSLKLANTRSGLADLERRILETRRKMSQGPQLQPGDFLSDGRYQLHEQLGHGGIATVWKAWDEREQRLVAVKVLHGRWADTPYFVNRFARGARTMKTLRHNHIVGILEEKQRESGYHYFVMDYIDGTDLRRAVLNGSLRPDETMNVVEQICQALQYAHDNNVIHRDIKPANILLRADGHAFLTDFDLVWIDNTTGGTRTGEALGTFVYAAPEMMSNAKKVDKRADVYSMAMTIFFMLQRRDVDIFAIRYTAQYINELQCNSGVKLVLQRALDWDKEQRFDSVASLMSELRAAEAGVHEPPQSVPAPKETPPTQDFNWSGRAGSRRVVNGELINRLRSERGMKQSEIAREAGIDERQYRRYEVEEIRYLGRDDQFDNLTAIANVLGVTFDQLLIGE